MSQRPNLILVPGTLCDAALFGEIYKPLSYLATLSVADVGRDASISRMAARLLARAPERFSLAGVSLGGYVAFEVWRQAPERVAGIALLSTRADADDRVMRLRRGVVQEQVKRSGFLSVLPDLMTGFLGEAHQDRLSDSVTAMAMRVGEEAYLRQQRAAASRSDATELLGTISVPTLVMAGAEDRLISPTAQREMASLIPSARFEQLDGVGHLSPLEAPHIVSGILGEWLRSPDQAAAG
jgi:pimeloyl-ACP methyl ester carboxylesterase